MSSRSWLGAILVVVGMGSCAPLANADPPSSPMARTDDDVARRLAFIERRLAAGTTAAQIWDYGWTSAYGAATLAQFGIALGTRDPGLRADMAVGAFESSLGVLPFALLPFVPSTASQRLAAYPEATSTERRRKLARAERLLKKCAHTEAFGQSWLVHFGGLTVNIGFGLILAIGYHRVPSAVTNTLAGIAVSEVQIVTQPTAAIDDWEAYNRGDFNHGGTASTIRFSVVPSPGGLGIGARF